MRTHLLVLLGYVTMASVTPSANSANILCLMGMASPSHHIWNRSLMVALAKQGHNITALSIDIDEEATPNLHYIQLHGVYEGLEKYFETSALSEMAHNDPYASIVSAYDWLEKECILLLLADGVKTLKNYPNDFKFDVVIHDFTSGQCLLGFVDKFNKPPLISISAFSVPTYLPFVSGNPQFPAYVPLAPLPYSSEMTFYQRSVNLICHAYDRYLRHYVFFPKINKMAASYFENDALDLTSIEQNNTMTFINTDPSIDVPQPLLPNVVEVGGMHIQIPKGNQTLGKISDILAGQKFVIFFSLGSNIRSDFMTSDRIKMFLDAFSKFPEYNILWKYESDNLQNIPKNVYIQKWMPQDVILSSSNVKLFISHGGKLSTQEAIFFGVPILGMPIFGDQHQNIQKCILAGIAEKIYYNNMSVEILTDKIRTMLTTSSYQQNIKRRHTAFRNKLNTPLETAVYWVNYVIQNGGAEHFRTVLPHMPLWKFLMLDVVALFICLIVVIFLIVRKMLLFICRLKLFNGNLEKKRK